MTKLMITCPMTGEEVFTGIEMARETLAQVPEIVAHLTCPSCNQLHTWSKRDARLARNDFDERTSGGKNSLSGGGET